MTFPSSQSIVLPSRPRIERAFAVYADWLHPAKRALSARWRAYQARRREARAFDAVGNMDVHMLRDIGASDELIARAAADRRTYPRPEILFQLAAIAVGIAAMGMAAPALAVDAPAPQAAGNAYAGRPLVGVFTGEFVDGAPVYRFPAVIVTGSRKAEPARSEQPLAQRRPAKAISTRS